MSKPRILVIRGGATGDFLLTLPGLRLIRETFAHCHLEILGYQHIAALALHGGATEGTTYADAVRHIEAAPLAGFFARNGNLSEEWVAYFSSFNQVVSWLFDPDGIFEANVRRAGVKHYLSAFARINDEAHATAQLARGLESLALYLDEPVVRLIPTPQTRAAGRAWLAAHVGSARPAALHPGSGGAHKKWPVECWQALAQRLTQQGKRVLLIGGEADNAALSALAPLGLPMAHHLALPQLAAVLAECESYFGHDTGISHLAAAVAIPTTALFGPTDPAVWAPQGSHVRVITAPGGDLNQLSVDEVAVT